MVFHTFFTQKAMHFCKTCLEAKWNSVGPGACLGGFVAHWKMSLPLSPKKPLCPSVEFLAGAQLVNTKWPVTAGFTVLGWWLVVATRELGWDPQWFATVEKNQRQCSRVAERVTAGVPKEGNMLINLGPSGKGLQVLSSPQHEINCRFSSTMWFNWTTKIVIQKIKCSVFLLKVLVICTT